MHNRSGDCKYLINSGETAYWSLLTCINGGLAGMVSMCAGCNVLSQGQFFILAKVQSIKRDDQSDNITDTTLYNVK